MTKDVMVHSFLYFVENGFLMPNNTQPDISVPHAIAKVDEQKIHNELWRFQGPDACGVYKNTPAEIPPKEMDKKLADESAFNTVLAILSKVMAGEYDPTLAGGEFINPYTTPIGEAVRLYARTRWIGDDRIAENLVSQALRYIDTKIIERVHQCAVS